MPIELISGPDPAKLIEDNAALTRRIVRLRQLLRDLHPEYIVDLAVCDAVLKVHGTKAELRD